jgi:hypothetical protein
MDLGQAQIPAKPLLLTNQVRQENNPNNPYVHNNYNAPFNLAWGSDVVNSQDNVNSENVIAQMLLGMGHTGMQKEIDNHMYTQQMNGLELNPYPIQAREYSGNYATGDSIFGYPGAPNPLSAMRFPVTPQSVYR